MNFISIFDAIGPNMIGPSSSHTAGAASIALLAKELFQNNIVSVDFILYGSFAETYSGHGTDKALLGGTLGFTPNDIRIRDAFSIASSTGLDYSFSTKDSSENLHPNTVDITLSDESGYKQLIRGESIGGGKVRITRIDNIDVDFTGEYSTLIVKQLDKPGIVAHITNCLSKANVNIAFMRLFRENKGATAYTVVESDEKIPESILEEIKKNPHVEDLKLIQL